MLGYKSSIPRATGYCVAIFAITLRLSIALSQGDTWSVKADMPTARQGLTTCAVNGKIYAIGGVNYPGVDTEVLTTIEEYDPTTDSWTARSGMPTSRNWPACAVVSGKIFVIGGDRTYLSSPRSAVEEYDPASDVWTPKANMPTARSTHAAAVVDGKIYVIGGLTTFGAPPLAIVEAYDPVTDTWEQKASIPTPRGMPGASVVNGKIYVIGSFVPPGGPALPVVEVYDPGTDTWTRKADMPTARGGLACSTAHGRIYAVGGRNAATPFAAVEEYNPANDTWTKRTDMWSIDMQNPSGRFGLSTATVNDRIYAIGGTLFTQVPATTLSLTLEYTPPLLSSIRLTTTNTIIVAWPTSFVGFALEQTPGINTMDWRSVAATPMTVGDENQVVVTNSSGNQLYRLKRL
jgi:N-acetylneuraminic acid mutarotase